MRSFSTVMLAALVVLAIGCASNVRFNVRDRATGMPISNYRVTVDNQTYTAGETAQLNRAVWKNYVATVEAEGYDPAEYKVKKEIIPEFLIGGIIFWPAWGWCYGPSEQQEFYMSNTTPYMAEPQQMSNTPPYPPQESNTQQLSMTDEYPVYQSY